MTKRWGWFAIVAILLIFATGCSHRSGSGSRQYSQGTDGQTAPDFLKNYFDDTQTLEFHVDSLPFQDGINKIYRWSDLLIVQTNNSTIWGVNAKSMVVEWKYTGMNTEIEYNPTGNHLSIYLISKNVMYAINRVNGAERWRMDMNFTPCADPQEANFSVYIPTWEGKLYSVADQLVSGGITWTDGTGGQVTAKPARHREWLYTASSKGIVLRWNIETDTGIADFQEVYTFGDGVTADPGITRNGVFFGSLDYNLYFFDRILAFNGHYKSGSPISYVAVSGNQLFFKNKKYGFHCLDVTKMQAKRGASERPRYTEADMPLRWRVMDLDTFLFSGRRFDYFLDNNGNLVSIFRSTGERKWSHSMKDFDFILPSGSLGELFVATKDGNILSFREKS